MDDVFAVAVVCPARSCLLGKPGLSAHHIAERSFQTTDKTMPKIKMKAIQVGLNAENLEVGKKVYGRGYVGWSTGYTGRYGRKFIHIHIQYTSRRVKFLTPKARHIYQMSIGEKVPRSLHVDHIDNDCTNDVLENLQLLTPEENINKLYESLKENYGEAWAAQCVAKIRKKKRRAE